MMMPLNLVDTKSGMDYFTAANRIMHSRHGPSGGALSIAPIPVLARPPSRATRPTAARPPRRSSPRVPGPGPDWMTALWVADQFCYPACAATGAFTFFNQQYDSLAGQSTMARSEYNAMQLSLRKRWSHGYQFDFNYTLAHAKDHGSAVERGSPLSRPSTTAAIRASSSTRGTPTSSTGCGLRRPSPDQRQLDLRASVRPGQANRQNAAGWLNAVIGEWSLAGICALDERIPLQRHNCRSCWATNWNLQGNASLVSPGVLPETATTKDAVNGLPSPFKDPGSGASSSSVQTSRASPGCATCCGVTATSPSTSASRKAGRCRGHPDHRAPVSAGTSST